MMKQDKEIIRSVRKLASKECANWQDGFCVPDDCPCRVINPRYSAVHEGCIDCDWFIKAVLPRQADLHTAYWHEIFREECDAGEGWKNCARCHKPFIPASNRQKYCAECGQAARRTRDRLKQQSYRLRKKRHKALPFRAFKTQSYQGFPETNLGQDEHRVILPRNRIPKRYVHQP